MIKEYLKPIIQYLVCGLLAGAAICLICGGCQAIKGAAHDLSWTMQQIDNNIADPQ